MNSPGIDGNHGWRTLVRHIAMGGLETGALVGAVMNGDSGDRVSQFVSALSLLVTFIVFGIFPLQPKY